MKEFSNISLEEIVFEKREKSYGAYFLRRQYPKQLLFSFLVVGLLFSLGILIPFLWGNNIPNLPSTSLASLPPPPPIDERMPPPPPPSCYNGFPNTLTLILEKNHKISWWRGDCHKDSIQTTASSQDSLVKLIQSHLHLKPWLPYCYDESVPKNKFGAPLDRKKCWTPIFVIKSKKEAKYADFIGVLNALLIAKAPLYTWGEFRKEDSLAMLGIETQEMKWVKESNRAHYESLLE